MVLKNDEAYSCYVKFILQMESGQIFQKCQALLLYA